MCNFHNLYPLLANIRQTTFIAIRACPGSTYSTTMIHQTMAEFTALLWWNNFPKFHLHLFRVLNSVHQPDPVAESDTVRIRHDRRLAKDIPHDEIGTFSSYPR